jgi:hypothetical protein
MIGMFPLLLRDEINPLGIPFGSRLGHSSIDYLWSAYLRRLGGQFADGIPIHC